VVGADDGDGYRLSSADSWLRFSTTIQPDKLPEERGADAQINFSRPRRDTGGSTMSAASRAYFRRESDESWAQHANDLRPIREEARELSAVDPSQRSQSAMQISTNTASPLHSRPMTAESSRRSLYPASDVSSFRGATLVPTSYAPSIVMMGPLQETATSPSNFPVDSHRPPPKPPMHSFISPPILGQPKPPKGKLSFLNKFKRRAGSASDIVSDDGMRRGYAGYPENYDPSIRGNRVHDFSMPRASAGPISRQTYSSPGYQTGYQESAIGWAEEYKPPRQHTPVFTEHFDDAPRSDEAAVRAETLANQDFIARNSGPMPAMPPPAPTRNAPPPPPIQTAVFEPSKEQVSPISEPSGSSSLPEDTSTVSPLSPVMEDPSDFDQPVKRSSGIHRRTSSGRIRPSHLASASLKRSRQSSGSISSMNLPAHMDSRASRFSFQLVSNDSAVQERMLEERHKEREAAKKQIQKDEPMREESDEDNYDFDDMDDFEEDVPMIGEEWNTDVGLGNMTLDDMAVPSAAVQALQSNNVNSFQAPVNSFQTPVHSPQSSVRSPIQGLGISSPSGTDMMQPSMYSQSGVLPHNQQSQVSQSLMADDDMYFDDGLIDEIDFDDTDRFDESVLDDPNHHLFERKPKMPTHQDPNQAMTVNNMPNKDDAVKALEFTINPNSSPEALAQYHNILALAATKAAESGRFALEDDMIHTASEPSLIADESRTSKATTMSPPFISASEPIDIAESPLQSRSTAFHFAQDYDDYPYASDMSDYDSAFEEDPIIAAANADVLANDEDGIYGSEFGFYARPGPDSASGDAVLFNGGYFGPKTWGEIKRQRSTREPNLTPITERSEYSARNSFASLHTLADKFLHSPNPASSSPGLAQLARLSNGSWDADKNLEALMKLRKGAFGGSQASLKSVNSGRQPSSPLATSSATGGYTPARPNSGYSPMPGSSSRFRDLTTQAEESDGSTDAKTETEETFGQVHESQEHWQDEDATSEYSDTNEYENEQAQFGFHSLHPNYPITHNATTSGQAHPLQPFISVQEPTPVIKAPQSPPESEPSSAVSAPADFHSFSPTEKKSAPSYTAHRPPPLNTSLQPPPPPKGLTGTFYSPASTITTEVSSPTRSLRSPLQSTVGSLGRNQANKPKYSHSRQGSDTVAYTQERDEETGEFRWVLERKRTGEDGVESIVNRAVVENGTI
jgi:hypothetical protein